MDMVLEGYPLQQRMLLLPKGRKALAHILIWTHLISKVKDLMIHTDPLWLMRVGRHKLGQLHPHSLRSRCRTMSCGERIERIMTVAWLTWLPLPTQHPLTPLTNPHRINRQWNCQRQDK